MQRLTHIDLFSGIAGFALASSWAGFETIVFCEKDKFCQKILHKHWPDVSIIEDIHEFNGEQYYGATLLTGSFPCQPFSTAGKRRGKEDDRYLWPEMFRVISEARPTWVVAENVVGFVNMALDQTISDMESQGYETVTFNIPACAVNAQHIRQRIWIVGYTKHNGLNATKDKCCCYERDNRGSTREEKLEQPERSSGKRNTDMANPKSLRRNNGDDSKLLGSTSREIHSPSSPGCNIRGLETGGWKTVTNMGDMVNGVPSRLVGPEPNIPRITNEKDRDRVNKLRALGNAVVPQVAYQIIEKIAMIELGNCKRIFDSSTN